MGLRYIILCLIIIARLHVAGVYLSLRGMVYANNSVIQITEIGDTDPDTDLSEGLQCITDRIPCCRFAFRAGEWYMYTPERTVVPGESATVSFYRNRGYEDGTVNLNRPNGVTMPTGLFCCEVPSATGGDQTVCANIGKIVIIIIVTDIHLDLYAHCSFKWCCDHLHWYSYCRSDLLPELLCHWNS